MVGPGHEREAIFIGVVCLGVLAFLAWVGVWQQRVYLPRLAQALVQEMKKERMEKKI